MGKLKLVKPEHETLKDLVVATLRKAILYGDIKPGEQLKQEDIAGQLGISRMPVREALSQLENEGLIKNIPYKGCTVKTFTSKDIKEIYQIRKVLESYATGLATTNMTPEDIEKLEELMAKLKNCIESDDIDAYADCDLQFHHMIFEKSTNKRLNQFIKTIWKSFPMYLAYSIPQRIKRSFEEQSRILDAIREGDSKKASRLAGKQIETVYEEMKPHFEKTLKSDI
ncbi:MAG TPA: GntR family transcriptional regulator [Desulfobacterales bacterium]|nr:GntR family transcriptional regulator [Desulfobacterales bacterium]